MIRSVAMMSPPFHSLSFGFPASFAASCFLLLASRVATDLPAGLTEADDEADDQKGRHFTPRWFGFPAFGFLLVTASA